MHAVQDAACIRKVVAVVQAKGRRIREAFRSPSWRTVVEGWAEALGVAVAVLSADDGVLAEGPHGGYCAAVLGEPRSSHPTTGCVPFEPAVGGEDMTMTSCRAGLACLVAPIELGGDIAFRVVVGGFVTSSADRELLVQRAQASGLKEPDAREFVRDLPVYSPKRAAGIARMAVAQARAFVTGALERADLQDRVDGVRRLLDAGRDFSDAAMSVGELTQSILARAVDIVEADGGSVMLLRPGSDVLDVVADVGPSSEARGGHCRVGEGVAGHVAATGRPVAVTGDRSSAHEGDQTRTSLSVPLRTAESSLGVLNVSRASGPAFTEAEVGLAEGFAAFAAAALRQARHTEEAQTEIGELTHLNEVALLMHVGLDVDEIAPLVASVVEKSVEFTVGGVFLSGFGQERGALVVRDEVTQGDVRAVLAEALGRSEDECRLDEISVSTHQGAMSDGAEVSRDDWCVLSTELLARDVVVGYLFAACPGEGGFDYTDARILRRLAAHVAMSFDRSAQLERVRADFAKTVAALSAAMDANERMQRGHTYRVMDYSMAIGREMGLGFDDVEVLRFAGLLHDVGKVGLTEEILLKPSKLTEEEMARVRKHSEIGAGIVSEIRFLNAIAPVILHHHERWDGRGYPMGLAGQDIPLLARILGAADAYDAMCSRTPYREALTCPAARTELESGAGSQFDPEVVEAFLAVLDERAAAGLTGLLGYPEQDGRSLPA